MKIYLVLILFVMSPFSSGSVLHHQDFSELEPVKSTGFLFDEHFLWDEFHKCKNKERLYLKGFMNTIYSEHIIDVFLNEHDNVWNSNGIQLYLKSEILQVFYNPQCMYSYPAKIEGNQIVYYWEYKMDCTFDRELNKDFSGVSSPQVGDKFAALSLVEDEILEVTYYFPEWVARMNEYSTDVIALFPRYFYLKK